MIGASFTSTFKHDLLKGKANIEPGTPVNGKLTSKSTYTGVLSMRRE